MRFWDTSAIVPLIVDEPATGFVQRRLEEDPRQAVWWGTGLEAFSAIARRERQGEIDHDEAADAIVRLDALAVAWIEAGPTETVRRSARRLLRVHDLRAADALQLAAGLVASQGTPEALDLVTLDDRLAAAAVREGFTVLGAA